MAAVKTKFLRYIIKLSIVVPCFDEIQTIEAIINQVLSVQLGLERETIIVDDCSTDGARTYLWSVPAIGGEFS